MVVILFNLFVYLFVGFVVFLLLNAFTKMVDGELLTDYLNLDEIVPLWLVWPLTTIIVCLSVFGDDIMKIMQAMSNELYKLIEPLFHKGNKDEDNS